MTTLKPYCKGTYLYWLRQGKPPAFIPRNPYLIKAKGLTDLLFTIQEIKEGISVPAWNQAKQKIIEFGCYYGETLIKLALSNPDKFFLGVENKYKRAVKSVQNIRKQKLSNAAVVIADGRELVSVLKDNSLAGMVILFPDPWLKKSRQKHRMINFNFLKTAKDKLMQEGFIWFKTDQMQYFDKVKQIAESLDFSLHSSMGGRLGGQNYFSFFNTLFLQNKREIHQGVLIK